MNLRDWYYKQIVTQAQMDEAFDWAEDADHDYVIDSNLSGLIRLNATEWDSQPTTPASMTLEVQGGPHRAYSKAGERIYLSGATETIDCSVDEYGVSTTVTTGGNSRWVSVYARFKRLPADPEVDGSSVLVYTRQYEDAELFIRQGSEAVSPVRPALLSDALLVCDINISFAQTTVQLAHIFVDRTEWWYSKTAMASLPDQISGNIKVALESLWDELDTVAGGGGPFTFTSTWFGGTAVGGGAPTTFATALDAIVADLAASTGSALVGTADISTTYVSWSSQSIAGALSALATAVNNHIGGAAPQHPAASITFVPTAMVARGYASTTDVQAAIDEVVDRLWDQASGSSGTDVVRNYTIPESYGKYFSLSTDTLRNNLIEIMGYINLATHWDFPEIVPQVYTGLTPASNLRKSSVGWHLPSSMAGTLRPGATMKSITTGNYIAEAIAPEYPSQSMQPMGWGNYRKTGYNILHCCPGYIAKYHKLTPFMVADDFDGVIYHEENALGSEDLFTGTWPSTTYEAYAVACDSEKTYVALKAGTGTEYIRLLRFDTDTGVLEENYYFGTAYVRPSLAGTDNMIVTHDALYLTLDTAAGSNAAILGVKKDDFTTFAAGGGNLPSGVTGYCDGGLCNIGGAASYSWWNTSGGGLLNSGYACQAVLDYSGAPVITTPVGSIHAAVEDLGTHVSSIVFDGVYSWWLDYVNDYVQCCYEIDDGVTVITYSERWCNSWNNVSLSSTTHRQFFALDGQRLLWFGLDKDNDQINCVPIDCRRAFFPFAPVINTTEARAVMYIDRPDFPSAPLGRTRIGRACSAGGITVVLGDYEGSEEVFYLYNTHGIYAAQ